MAVKKKKYPKSPKATAPLKTWEKYRDRVKEIDRLNSQIETDKKKKSTLISMVSKMKSKR